MTDKEPKNPFENMPEITELLQAAASMKEMFDTFMEAGFTERQALILLAEIARGGKGESDT